MRSFLVAFGALLCTVGCVSADASCASNAAEALLGKTTHPTTGAGSGSCSAQAQQPDEHKTSIVQTVQSTARRLFQSASATVPSYYLLWSPGSTKRLIGSTLWLAVFHVYKDFFVVGQSQSRLYQAVFGSQWVQSLVLPLLSSACCAIQLILNIVGFGCAGFNTYLGPVRPYFVTLLLYLSLLVYPPFTVTGWLGVVARTTMALLPELVHFYNTYGETTMSKSVGQNDLLLSQETRILLDGEATLQATVELSVPTMGCVACVNKINASLRQSSPQHFLEGKSWLNPDETKGGRASVSLLARDETELQALIQKVQDEIHAAGFENTQVESVERSTFSTTTDSATEINRGGNQVLESTVNQDTIIEKEKVEMAPAAPAVATRVEYLIPSMSCEGCIHEINTAARQVSSNVVKVSSWLLEDQDVGGKASVTLHVESKKQLDDILGEIRKSWEAAGFDDNTLQSLEYDTTVPILGTVTWLVPGMHCGSCANSIDSAVQEAFPPKHLVSVSSQMNDASGTGGTTTVTLKAASPRELDKLTALLERSIQNAGFDDLRIHDKQWKVRGNTQI